MKPLERVHRSGRAGETPALVRMALEGLLCASCAATAAAVLRRVPGVAWAGVSIVTSEASVSYDASQTSPERLARAIEKGGFGVAAIDGVPRRAAAESEDSEARGSRREDVRRAVFPVYGLGCGGGAARTVERALERVGGVKAVYVNPAEEMAHVVYDPEVCTSEALAAAVVRAGYRAGAVEEIG